MGDVNWIAVVILGAIINLLGLVFGTFIAKFIVWVRNRLYKI
jgi:hypothetical protein